MSTHVLKKKAFCAAVGAAIGLFSAPSFADLERLNFTNTSGEEVSVRPNKKHINPVNSVDFVMSAGVERVLRIRIEDTDGLVVAEQESSLITATDRSEERRVGIEHRMR